MPEFAIDVLVIGAGGAGLAAALGAAQSGAKVVVLEKTDFVGGPNRVNPGSLGMCAVESWMQTEMHVGVSLASAYRKLMEHSRWRTDGRIVSSFLRNSGGTIEWFNQMGVHFDRVLAYYTGGEVVFHVRNDPETPIIADVLEAKARELHVDFNLQTRATRLLMENGSVIGCEARDQNGRVSCFHASRTVIATGGYQGSPELIEKFTGLRQGVDLFTFEMFTHPQHQGEGLLMAWEVGVAKSPTMLETYLYLPDPYGGPGGTAVELSTFRQPGLLVNQLGLRFVDETIVKNPADSANAVRRQPGSYAYMITTENIDHEYRNKGLDYQLFGMYQPPGKLDPLCGHISSAIRSGYKNLFRAETLEELATHIGVPEHQLAETVAIYDESCRKGVDQEFFKDAKYLREIGSKGPFFAAKFCLGSYGSSGGIAINEHGQALNSSQCPIPGLYAAGRDANSIYGGTYPFSFAGAIEGFSYTMGRLAGKHAADSLR